jgi:hypothetical protein
MVSMEPIITFLNAINHALDYLVAVLFILFLLLNFVRYTIGRVRNYLNIGEYLFYTDLSPVDDLNKGNLPYTLTILFEEHQIPLTPQAHLRIKKIGSSWDIIDTGKQFSIRKEDIALTVCERKVKKAISKGLFLGIIYLTVSLFLGYLLIQLPYSMAKAVYREQLQAVTAQASGQVVTSTTISIIEIKINNLSWIFRWILLYLSIPPYFYFRTRKNGHQRGLIFSLVTLTILLFGWLFERWVGIILISVPISAILLFLIYHLAQAILPSASPEEKKERQHKYNALLAYMTGMQMPVWTAKESASQEFETLIPGDTSPNGSKPGIIWTHSHQVAGITAGTEFSRVDGPGTIFTTSYERAASLVDLRRQVRTQEFDALTKDGIAIKARISIDFEIDFEDWPKKNWRQPDLKQMADDIAQNPYLEKGIKVDRKIGSYWYSTARVKSVLSTIGINTNPKDSATGSVINWDEWIVKHVENVARQILSQRTVDELWRPVDNKTGAGALDEIAFQIRESVGPKLRRLGITLFSCRVVNFDLPKDSPIRKQQIDTWKTLWDQRITAILSNAAAIRKEEIEKAHAYAKSEVLDAIADSIEKARALHPDLPRHVIALYFIHAIEEVIRKRPDSNSQEAKERLDTIKNLLYNQ